MDINEQLLALQKAYADVLVNLSKESAERVMDLMKMAARQEYELKVTREEGARMLTRLKEMMDSKIIEAEADKKKIEVLEAQLNEAEDIVKDLREELRDARDKLERAKSNDRQAETKPDNTCTPETSIGSSHPLCQSLTVAREPQTEFPVASVVTMPCINKAHCFCASCNRNRYLPSILSRFSRRCTRGINACEANSLDKEPCLSENSNELKANKNDAKPELDNKEPASRAEASTETAKELLKGAKTSKYYGKKGKSTNRKEKLNLRSKEPEPSERKTRLVEVSSVKNADKDVEENSYLERKLDEAITEIQTEPVKERVFAITYQRKRKRQALVASNVNVSFETGQDSVDRQLEEEEVALQLILLSEQNSA